MDAATESTSLVNFARQLGLVVRFERISGPLYFLRSEFGPVIGLSLAPDDTMTEPWVAHMLGHYLSGRQCIAVIHNSGDLEHLERPPQTKEEACAVAIASRLMAHRLR